jgi:uncharacterized phage protein (TIGR01671 family)
MINKDRFKFRVFDKKKNTMYYEERQHKVDFEYILSQDNLVLMQCTALKDRNDKLIYEGDIVESQAIKDYVVFRNGVFTTNRNIANQPLYTLDDIFFLNLDLLNTGDTLFDILPSFKVIGNMYENKELLK